MPYTATTDKENKQEAYLKALSEKRDVSLACTAAKLNGTHDVRNWRWRDKVFEGREKALAQKLGIDLKGTKKKATRRKHKAAVEKVDLNPYIHQETPHVPPQEPTASIDMQGEGREERVNQSPIIERESYEKMIKEHSQYLRDLKGQDYKKTDEALIALASDSWATLQVYNYARFQDSYSLRMPVRSTSVLECNPFEDKRREELKIYMDCLRKLGLTHEVRDYKAKKSSGLEEFIQKVNGKVGNLES